MQGRLVYKLLLFPKASHIFRELTVPLRFPLISLHLKPTRESKDVGWVSSQVKRCVGLSERGGIYTFRGEMAPFVLLGRSAAGTAAPCKEKCSINMAVW